MEVLSMCKKCEPSTFPGGSSASLDNVTIIMAGATEGEVTVAAAFMVVEEGTVEAEEGVVTDVVRRPFYTEEYQVLPTLYNLHTGGK